MAHLLGELVASGGQYFENLVKELEDLSGNQATDVDLIGEVLTQTNLKIRQLGLTPGDTRCEEIYQALLVKYEEDSKRLRYQLLGDNEQSGFIHEQLTNELNKVIDLPIIRVKTEALKQKLKSLSPNETLRELGLNSVDDLFAKYRLGEIAIAVRLNEDRFWLEEWLSQIATLGADDFQLKPLETYFMDEDLVEVLGDDLTADYAVIGTLTGSVILAQKAADLGRLDLLAMLNDISVKISQLVASSNQLQVLIASSQYAENIRALLMESTFRSWSLGGQLVPWWSIFRAIGRPDSTINLLVQAEFPQLKFSYFDPIDWLVEQYSMLDFWKDGKYLAFKSGDQVVSLNLADVSDNYNSGVIDCRVNFKSHLEEGLWDELIFRYLNQSDIGQDFIKTLKEMV